LNITINLSQLLSIVCSKSIFHFIQIDAIVVFDTLSIVVKVVLLPHSEAEPHPHLTVSWRQPWWSYSFQLTSY